MGVTGKMALINGRKWMDGHLWLLHAMLFFVKATDGMEQTVADRTKVKHARLS